MAVVNENKQKEKVSLSSPLFAVIYDKTRLKMAELEDKNAKLTKKNKKAQVKLERSEYMVNLIKQIKDLPDISENLPAPLMKLMDMMAKQEQDRFKSLKSKIEKRTSEISYNNKKISKHNIHIETCVSIDKFVKNLKSPTAKKEVFIEGLQEFNNIAIRKAQNKLADINEKISKVLIAKSKTHSASKQVKLDNKIRKLTKQKEALENKIKGFDGITDKINAVKNAPEEKVDKVIEKSCDGIVNAATENPDRFAKNQAETVVEVCNEVIDEELPPAREQKNSKEAANKSVDEELPSPAKEQETSKELLNKAVDKELPPLAKEQEKIVETVVELRNEVTDEKLPVFKVNLDEIINRITDIENILKEVIEQKEPLDNKLKSFSEVTNKTNTVQNTTQNKVDEVIESSDKIAKNQAETVVEVCNEVIDEELPSPAREQKASKEAVNKSVDEELPSPTKEQEISKESPNKAVDKGLLSPAKEQERLAKAEKEPVFPESTSEYEENVSETGIKNLLNSNIKFVAVKDKKHKDCYIVKYKKSDSDNVKQILDRPLENSLRR